MIKSILKEVCITILLCTAMVLAFGIIFYDYIPINKVIPEKVAYEVPTDVKSELNEEIFKQESKPAIRYSVTSSDLKTYESTTVYQPGNPNPFKAYSTKDVNGTIIGNGIEEGNTNSQNSIQYYYPTNTSTK